MTTPKSEARVDTDVSDEIRSMTEAYIRDYPTLAQRELRDREVAIWDKYREEKTDKGYEFIHVLSALVGEQTEQKSHHFNYRRRLFNFPRPLDSELAKLVDEKQQRLSSVHALGALVVERCEKTKNDVPHELNELLSLAETTGLELWSDVLRNHSRKSIGMPPFIREGNKRDASITAAIAVFGAEDVEAYLKSGDPLATDSSEEPRESEEPAPPRRQKQTRTTADEVAIVKHLNGHANGSNGQSGRRQVDQEHARRLKQARELLFDYMDTRLAEVPELHRPSLARILKHDFQMLTNILHSAVAKYAKLGRRQEGYRAVVEAAEILGVNPKTYTTRELKTRLRNLALSVHPDLNPTDPEAMEQMRLVNDAFMTLRKYRDNHPQKEEASC